MKGKKIAFAPPPLKQAEVAPSTLDRKESGKGKTEQINFQVSPELKKAIKLMCAELGISQQDYLERIHTHYQNTFKGQK